MTPNFDPTTHRYTTPEGKPLLSVTQILKLAGLIDDRWFTEEACWKGSVVHKVCELDCKGTLDESSVDPAAAGYLAAWRAWKNAVGFKALEIEQPMANDRYAGTPDRTGSVGYGHYAVVDLKTGSTAKWHSLQLAAYGALAFPPWPRAARRFTVRLQDDGRYITTPYEDFSTDWAAFQGALAVANWRMANAV